MKNNFKTFPDSRKFEPKEEDEDFADGAYIVAISTWFLDFKKELKEKLEETEKQVVAEPNPFCSNYPCQMQVNLLREILGISTSNRQESKKVEL